MERKKASDFPQGLLNLFDQYLHGAISRRAFLDGAQNFAVGGVTASALFEIDTTPRYDEAAARLAWQRTLDWLNKYPRSPSPA
jgi:dienelactone hydrolase